LAWNKEEEEEEEEEENGERCKKSRIEEDGEGEGGLYFMLCMRVYESKRGVEKESILWLDNCIRNKGERREKIGEGERRAKNEGEMSGYSMKHETRK
jgi:hypothetical protein